MESPEDHVSAEVLAELARRRMTRAVLAERIGISADTLSDRLSGKYPWRFNELVAIADVFGTTTADLLARAERNAQVA